MGGKMKVVTRDIISRCEVSANEVYNFIKEYI